MGENGITSEILDSKEKPPLPYVSFAAIPVHANSHCALVETTGPRLQGSTINFKAPSSTIAKSVISIRNDNNKKCVSFSPVQLQHPREEHKISCKADTFPPPQEKVPNMECVALQDRQRRTKILPSELVAFVGRVLGWGSREDLWSGIVGFDLNMLSPPLPLSFYGLPECLLLAF